MAALAVLQVEYEYTVDIRSDISMSYMQQTLESMKVALKSTPQLSIRAIKVMPLEERSILLHGWNQTVVTQPPVCCLHQLFEAQVEFDEHAVAVEFGGQSLSYAELNSCANQLAHHLILQGIKPDNRIALCVERSINMIIAMLGILKAGCAYIPLDPVHSSQRLTDILHDADPICVITDIMGRTVLADHQVPMIALEKPLPIDLSIDNVDTIKLGLTPSHLAYVIYTSGSTGTPKGVMAEHRQVVRIFTDTHKKFGFNKQDKCCLFHSISFDFSVTEIWGAICYGSQLFIVPYYTTLSADEFYDWICNNGITVLCQTPSAFKMLMRAKNISSQSQQLRYIMLSGEELDSLVAREWYEKYKNSGTVLVNMYGPTETTLYATFQRLNSLESTHSIGQPLPDLSVYLLDLYGEPVLLGAEGDMYISGAGVTRGYWNRSKLTIERFLPDLFSNNSSARMYSTGDRARYLSDGNLVYLGRVDQQVKIRGFRIEVGEIEARLVEHSKVHGAVVLSFGDGSDTRLIAYVVADANTTLPQNLRTYLLNLLPDYMVPAAFVCLPSLPLTPNGKLDRRALPAPNDEAFARQEYEAPQGELENKLANIWRELLGIERISRHDNFFALGGHSLLVVRLLAQLRQIELDTNIREVFDAPTLAVLASNLDRYKAMTIPPNVITINTTKITPEMLPLITLSQADIDVIASQVPGGVPNIGDIYGLTPLQSGMLFHYLMEKESDPYLLRSQLRFIDRKWLERYADAMQQVIERHDILRTAIYWDGLSEPAQVVCRQVPSLFTEIVSNDHNNTALERISQEFDSTHRRLDLTRAPLIRLLAAPESDGTWVALQLTHHSIIDNSTHERLQLELLAVMNEAREISTAHTSFREFVARTRLGISPAEHTHFFTEMLSGIDEPTLPFGLNDVNRDKVDINEEHLEITQTLNDQLRMHARNSQVSLASICHLAWAQVLAKASGRESVVFGTVLLGRLQSEEENSSVMGPMINTLPLRLDVDDESVEKAIRKTHAQLSALLAHEHAPLVLAQRCSGVPSNLPLISALLNYRYNQNAKEVKESIRGVSFISDEGRTNYLLTLSIDDDGTSLYLTAQVVSPISSIRVGAYIQQALKSTNNALTHTPQQPVGKLNVMPSEERTMLMHSWNQIMITHSSAVCLHQLFETQVEIDGQAVAVEFGGQSLSYAELNSRANQLAHYLISQGVKPDNRIALCVERSINMIIAMLGILKAGCAYIPLDPVHSSQRLTDILHDADPICVITDITGRRVLADHQVPMIALEKPLPIDLSINNQNTNRLELNSSHLAYVIYTSGSTGTPKGVMIEHRQVVRLFEVTHDKFDFNKQNNRCLFHSFSFDVSVWEIWGALHYGNQLSIIPYHIARSMDELYDWICSNGITVLCQTPSAFKTLMRAKNISSRFDQIRYVIFAGEALDPLIVKEWHVKHEKSGTMLVNMYGTTETTVHATFYQLDFTKNITTVGRPLSDLCVYLLDKYGEPVIIGSEGEICIGGAGVARGYLNRPELNAEHFLPDPFKNDPSARMYRTGDLARYLPDGCLVFLGRSDHQVKIRGFRIELGEIETRLVEHSQVHEAVVLSFNNGPDAYLVAYVIADEDTSLIQSLRTYLSSLLPDYMVPSAYVCLPSLPLTSSGKLDRRALPAPGDDAFIHQRYEAPLGEIEEKLADIWRELLTIDRISRHDNFFELGGHSLLVMHFVNKAKLNNMHIDARGVFSFPILKNLAEQIANQSKRLYCGNAAIPVRQYGNQTLLFLLADGGGDISYASELAQDIDKNVPVYMLPWPSPDNEQPTTIEEMANAMIPLIKKAQPIGPCAIAGYSSGGILAYEITKQLINSGHPVSFLGLIDTYATISCQLSEIEIFLAYLNRKFSIFKTITDSSWWDSIGKLTFNEAIDMLRKMNIDSKSIDIEWEALLSKQRYNYQNMCTAYKITSPPTTRAHLFKAKEHSLENIPRKFMDNAEKLFNHPKLGWEITNLTVTLVEGDHTTMMTNPKNRSQLGKILTKSLRNS